MTITVEHAGHPLTVAALVRDTRGWLLIVRGHGEDAPWYLPGGLVMPWESPSRAVHRQVRESLGLVIEPADLELLAVEWIEARDPAAPGRVVLLFASGLMPQARFHDITLDGTRLGSWRLERPRTALTLLHRQVAARLAPALDHYPALYRETHR